MEKSLTALLLRLIRPVFAVLDRVAHFGVVDALSVLTQELQGCLAFRGCREKTKTAAFVHTTTPNELLHIREPVESSAMC